MSRDRLAALFFGYVVTFGGGAAAAFAVDRGEWAVAVIPGSTTFVMVVCHVIWVRSLAASRYATGNDEAGN